MSSKWKTGIIALLAGSMLVGCSMVSNPSELVKPPRLETNQAAVKQAVEQFLPAGAKLTIPRRPAKLGSFKQVDLDGDGADEVVAFYKKEQTNFELGVLVLEKDGSEWKLKDNILGLGQEIDCVDFQDITGDKVPELFIGWGGGQGLSKELAVYTAQDKKYKQIGTMSYVDLSVGDLDGDAKAEVAVLIRNNKEIPASEVQLYRYEEGELKQTQVMEYEATYPENVTIGNADKDHRGIFVDVGLGAHSAYTQLVVLENGHLKNVLKQEKDDFPITFKAYPLISTDINEDGIVEIGLQTQPPGTEDLSMVQIPWIESWCRWDGKDGLVPVIQTYSDYREGYRLYIPQNWQDKFTIKRTGNEDFVMQSVDFYYSGSGKKALAELLSIRYVDKESWAEEEKVLQKEQVNYTVLGESSEHVFVGVLPSGKPQLSGRSLQEYRQMLLDKEKIKQAFNMLDREY